MLNTTIEEAFEINPTITIKRDAEVPFVSMDRLTPGQRDVDAGEIRQFRSGSKFEAGDTLMARITPCLENKKIARYLPNDSFNKIGAGSTEFIVLRGKPGITTTEFSYYFAITPEIHETAIALMTGTSGRQRVDMAAFRAQEVEIPELAEQRKITDLLGALDDKIAANSRIIKIATHLNINLVEKAVTKELEPLQNLADITMGSSPKGEFLNEEGIGEPFFQGVRDFGELFPSERVFAEKAVRTAQEGDILFAVRAPIGEVNIAERPCVIGRGIAAIRGKQSHLGLFYLLKGHPELWETYQSSGTVFAGINKSDLHNAVIPVLRDSEKLEQQLTPIHERAMHALRENQALARTRDELLPLLMSGRITVGEAEDAADKATSES